MIDLFNIRIGKFRPLESIVNLNDVVMEIFEVFSIQTNEKGLKLNLVTEKNFPIILLVDCARFKQVLVNLIANSLKFTFSGTI